jgi:hypothetical protein
MIQSATNGKLRKPDPTSDYTCKHLSERPGIRFPLRYAADRQAGKSEEPPEISTFRLSLEFGCVVT